MNLEEVLKIVEKLYKEGYLNGYSIFSHRKNNKIYFSKTEDIIKLELEQNKFLFNFPKEIEIPCFEYCNENLSTEKVIFTLEELRLYSITRTGEQISLHHT